MVGHLVEAVNVEMRGGIVHFIFDDGEDYALPPHIFYMASGLATDLLRQMDRRDNVIPLCELCKRYDLPKHED